MGLRNAVLEDHIADHIFGFLCNENCCECGVGLIVGVGRGVWISDDRWYAVTLSALQNLYEIRLASRWQI